MYVKVEKMIIKFMIVIIWTCQISSQNLETAEQGVEGH